GREVGAVGGDRRARHELDLDDPAVEVHVADDHRGVGRRAERRSVDREHPAAGVLGQCGHAVDLPSFLLQVARASRKALASVVRRPQPVRMSTVAPVAPLGSIVVLIRRDSKPRFMTVMPSSAKSCVYWLIARFVESYTVSSRTTSET